MQQNNLTQEVIGRIIEALDLKGMPEQTEREFRDNMEAQIMKRLGLIIMANLDNEGLKKFEKMVAVNPALNQEDLQAFLEENLLNYKEIIQQGMDQFIREVAVAAVA